MKYYQSKFRWSPSEQKEVDWVTYKQIIRKFHHQQTTLVKHLHNIAPTGKIAHRNNPHHPSKCPSCPQDPETNNHIMKCRARSRQNWRAEGTQRLQHYLTNTVRSDPILCDILRDGIQRWHNNLPQIAIETYPTSYHQLISSQNRIGWSHLYRARWSVYWSQNHHRYARTKELPPHQADGRTWVRKAGQRLLADWFDLWNLRNKERHGATAEEQYRKKSEIVTSQTRELYNKRQDTMATDRAMYCTTIEEHFKVYTTQEQRMNWVSMWRQSIMASIHQAKESTNHTDNETEEIDA